MTQTYEVLRKARALIDIGWTKGASARNKRHESTSCLAPNAICWCIGGAIDRAAAELDVDSFEAYNALGMDLDAIIAFNDSQPSKKPILALFDRALEKLNDQNGSRD